MLRIYLILCCSFFSFAVSADSDVWLLIDTAARKIEVKKRIEVLSDSIELNFYDNGDIDNDTITVYYNKQMILNKQRLSDRPVTVKINVSEKSENEIVMFADNLGSIPPNTAILIFEDKGVRHEVKIDSNLKSSGSVYIYRK